MDRTELIERIAAAYADFAADRIDVSRLPFSAEVEWVEPPEFPFGGTYRGPAAVQEYLERSRAGWQRITSAPRRVFVNPSQVAVLVEHRGVRTDGTQAAADVLDVFTIERGEIVRMDAFGDSGRRPD